MRAIKFRGKCTPNYRKSTWVYGDIMQPFNGVGNIAIRTPKEDYIVIPETVGQFTGLLDRNGKEVYEGDILGREVDGVKYPTQTIEYKDCGLFAKRLIIGADFFFEIKSVLEKYHIIGNIHDNPELLKTE